MDSGKAYFVSSEILNITSFFLLLSSCRLDDIRKTLEREFVISLCGSSMALVGVSTTYYSMADFTADVIAKDLPGDMVTLDFKNAFNLGGWGKNWFS